MRDYIIDTDVTITFAVKYGGKTILDEEYVPDANNQVRVRKLGKFVSWRCGVSGVPEKQAGRPMLRVHSRF